MGKSPEIENIFKTKEKYGILTNLTKSMEKVLNLVWQKNKIKCLLSHAHSVDDCQLTKMIIV